MNKLTTPMAIVIAGTLVAGSIIGSFFVEEHVRMKQSEHILSIHERFTQSMLRGGDVYMTTAVAEKFLRDHR